MPMAGLKVDHINYLIWRYLQESGFGRTAIQLQHEWTEEPQSLSFAHAVDSHELISLVQDGLAYDDISSQVDSVNKRYTFVEARKRLAPEPETADETDNAVDGEAAARSRKRPKLDRAGDSTDRRKRMSSSKQNASDDDAMEVDGVHNHVPPKLEIEEPSPLLTTAEIGQEKGVQSRKIFEPLVAVTVAMLELPNADVMNLCWPVFDGKEGLLATGGGICRWYDSLSKADQGSNQTHVNDRTWTHDGSSVTCSTIDSSGELVAYASDDATRYTLTIRMPSIQVVASWTDVSHTGFGTVSVTRWNKSSQRLMYATFSLGQAPDPGIVSRLAVLETMTNISSSPIVLEVPVEDAAWTDDQTLLICGDGLLALLQIEGTNIVAKDTIETDALWSLMRYDEETGRACCISPEDSNIALLNITDNEISFHSKTSHGAQITAMEWQPQPESLVPEPMIADTHAMDESHQRPNRPRIVATAAIDGSIKIWDARNDLICLRTLIMETGAPAMTLAFSPTGTYIAAAGNGCVFIWLVDEGPEPADVLDRKDKPVVTWRNETSTNGESSEQSGMNTEEDLASGHPPFHVLAWNRAGDTLAYSEGDKVRTFRIWLAPYTTR